MQIKIISPNLKLSDAQQALVEEKVGKLTRLADRIGDESTVFEVEFKQENMRSKTKTISCHMSIFAPRGTLHANAVANIAEKALDAAISKLKKQIERYKAKIHHEI